MKYFYSKKENKQKEFMGTKPALQRKFKDILHIEELKNNSQWPWTEEVKQKNNPVNGNQTGIKYNKNYDRKQLPIHSNNKC